MESDLYRENCPICGAPTYTGYGLAMGGIGTYTICTGEKCDWEYAAQDPQAEAQGG